jgi:hypothetical protein
VPSTIAATRLTNAHAKSEQLAMLLTSFVFIVVVSFCLSFFLFWPSLASHCGRSYLAVHSGTPQNPLVRYAESWEDNRGSAYAGLRRDRLRGFHERRL